MIRPGLWAENCLVNLSLFSDNDQWVRLIGMSHRVLAVLAGGTASFQPLGEIFQWSDVVYAADSGQDICLRNGFRPDVVVGDLDSLSERLDSVEYRERLDQDFSDCDKLLAEITLLGKVDLVIAGLEGDRFDHVLSSLSSIVRSGLEPRILFRQGFGMIFREGSSMVIEEWLGRGFSIIGLGETIVSTKGAHWEMEQCPISFDAGFSLSNLAEKNSVEVSVHRGVALVIQDSGIIKLD